MTSFEELAKLAQKSRNPCGKQAFSLGTANKAARERSILSDTAWFVHPCYFGCGGSIFHLTRQQPRLKNAARHNGNRGSKLSKRSRKKARHKANQAQSARLAITGWEDDGGALHPSEREN